VLGSTTTTTTTTAEISMDVVVARHLAVDAILSESAAWPGVVSLFEQRCARVAFTKRSDGRHTDAAVVTCSRKVLSLALRHRIEECVRKVAWTHTVYLAGVCNVTVPPQLLAEAHVAMIRFVNVCIGCSVLKRYDGLEGVSRLWTEAALSCGTLPRDLTVDGQQHVCEPRHYIMHYPQEWIDGMPGVNNREALRVDLFLSSSYRDELSVESLCGILRYDLPEINTNTVPAVIEKVAVDQMFQAITTRREADVLRELYAACEILAAVAEGEVELPEDE
jgi:hypothetical protein